MYRSFNARAAGLPPIPAARAIDLAAGAGFEGVDLMLLDLDRDGDDPGALRDRIDRRGLRGGAFPLPVSWRGDESTYRRDRAALPRLAAIARRLGLLRTGTWALPETLDGPGDEAARLAATRALHLDRLGPIAEILAEHDIRLGLEFLGPPSSRPGRAGPFATTTATLVEHLAPLLDRHPNVGLLVDAFHSHACGEGIDAPLSVGAGRIAWVHVADLPAGHPGDRGAIVDAERGLPGDAGVVPVAPLLEGLARLGYDGPVTAEPLGRTGGWAGLDAGEVAGRIAAALDRAWPGFKR